MRIRIGLSFSVCVGLGLSSGISLAQTEQSPGQGVVHIAIHVRQLSGDPVIDLRSSNFTLLSSGMPLAFRMDSAASAHHSCVLVVVAPGVSKDPGTYLNDGLPSKLPGSYSLSAMGPDGAYVGPVGTRDELVEGFLSRHVVFKGYVQAIDDLAECRGERSIIYTVARPENPPLEFVRASERAGALIYEVGGDPRQNYTYFGEPNTTAPAQSVGIFPLQTAMVPGAETWESSPSLSIRTVYTERSVRQAFREIMRVSRGWYGVTLNLPHGAKMIELKAKIPGQYQLSAVDWIDVKGTPPTLTLSK